MASGSLGTLTLDLAVRLSEFTDGLTQAERQARDSASNISDSVSNLRDSIAEDMSKISGSFVGMAIGGAVVAAGALAAMAIEAAKADVQLGIMAGTANTSLKSFQVLTHAAAGFGIEQEALAAILADTQEKLGEFSATGGGGAADFFEALQNNTKMTDEQIRELGKTLQGKDGVGAIQYLKDELDALGATSQEQRFIMQSLAGDLGNLMPLFANGGATLEEYGKQLEDAGVIKTQEAIDQSRVLAAETQAIQTRFEGVKTQLVAEMIPALGTLITHFTTGKTEGKGFRTEVDNVGKAIRATTSLVVGLAAGVSIIATSFQTVGAQMRMIGETSNAFYSANGLRAKGAALAAGFIGTAGVTTVGLKSITDQYKDAVSTIDKLMAGQQNRLSDLGQVYYDSNTFLQSHSDGLATNTVEAEANAKALEKQAKAAGKSATAVSNQMMVYKAFRHAGLSDNQARIITAEVGRENDYQSKFLFGGHNDPHNKKYNLGLISWQKERGEKLYKYLKDLGLIQNNQIVKTQEALNAQAMFALQEMTTNPRFDKTKNQFLANPDISYDEGTEVLGKNYIAWRYTDAKYASHHKRRDKHYNKLNAELGGADVSKIFAAENKAAQDAQKAQEELQRKQLAIVNQYATDKEQIELQHTKNVLEIKAAYAEGTTEYSKYMGREEVRYSESKNASLISIAEKYLSEEQQIHDRHRKALKQIEAEDIQDDTTRQMFIDVQNAMYQKDLDNFRFAAGEKAREQDKLYQSLANSMRANSNQAASDGLDRMAQRTMSSQDYEVWRLAQDHDEAFNSVNNDYANRQAEINDTDERGKFKLPELERFELLELAKQEHMDKMWAMEEDFATKQQQLDEQQRSARLDMYQNLFGGLAGLTSAFFGEQSAAHRVMFGIEKGFAIAQSAMAIQQSIAKAMALGFPANIPVIAQAVGQGAEIVNNIKSVSLGGIAHGGLDYVPKESTYLLDKGERVLSPNQNSDLTKFMSNGGSGGGVGDVNITVNVDAKGNSSMSGDTADGFAKSMGKAMEATAVNVITKELRQGGIIDRRLRK